MRAREFESDLAALSFWTRSEIDQCTRQLRQGGLLPVGGRGLNAPEITPEHAALILIGLSATHTGRSADVLDAVKTYGPMPPVGEAFADATSFADAMTSILSSWNALRSVLTVHSVVVCATWPEATVNIMTKTGERLAFVYGNPDVEHPGPGMRADVTFSPATLSMLSRRLQEAEQEGTSMASVRKRVLPSGEIRRHADYRDGEATRATEGLPNG